MEFSRVLETGQNPIGFLFRFNKKMQIFCNHCGTTIYFPDYQRQVTCPSCDTYLQIEEEKERITVAIIQERDFNPSIFEQKHASLDLHNFSDLFDLMRLEEEYDEKMHDNFALSLTAGKKLRPMLLRGLYRTFFGGLLSFWILDIFSANLEGFWINMLPIVFLIYGLFLMKTGIKETIKWFRLWKFEKEYKKEKAIILEKLHFSIQKLPNNLKQNFANFEDNEKYGKTIEKEFFHVEILKKLRIYTGSPSASKALRMFAIFVPTGFFALFIGFQGAVLGFVYAIFAVIMTFFGFFIMSDSSAYEEEEQKYWTKREKHLEVFINYF
jgi:hypothetical protein